MMLIPAKEGSKIGVGMRTSSGDNEFSFGIETNLAGTPAMDRVWEYISKSKEFSLKMLEFVLILFSYKCCNRSWNSCNENIQ